MRLSGRAKNAAVTSRHMPSPMGTVAPAQNPNSKTSAALPSVELPSTACAASIVPTITRGRLLPATMRRLPLFLTSLPAKTPTASVSAMNAVIAMPKPSNSIGRNCPPFI